MPASFNALAISMKSIFELPVPSSVWTAPSAPIIFASFATIYAFRSLVW